MVRPLRLPHRPLGFIFPAFSLLLLLAAFPAGASCPPDSLFSNPAPGYVVGSNPHAVVVADFNGDGSPDVAVANSGAESAGPGTNTVSVRLGFGEGAFGLETRYP